MLNVGIINITGYAGAELARLVYSHPEINLVSATGRSKAGLFLDEVFNKIEKSNIKIQEEISDDVEFVFSALPNVFSAEALKEVISSGIKAIDIAEIIDFIIRRPDNICISDITILPKSQA